MKVPLAICAMATVTLLASTATAQEASSVEIEGKLVLTEWPDLSNASNSFSQWQIPSRAFTPRVPVEQLLIVIARKDSDKTRRSPQKVTVPVGAFKMTPFVQAVTPGSKVTFVNEGPGAYALSTIGTNRLKEVVLAEQGDSVEVTLKKQGLYTFQDKNHPSVITHIIAIDFEAQSPLTQLTATRFGFNLGALSPAEYTLKTFLQGKQVHSKEVTITSTPTSIDYLLTKEELRDGLE